MSTDPTPGLPERLLQAFDFAAELEARQKEHDDRTRALLGGLLEVLDSFDRFFAAGPPERPTPEQAAQILQTFRLVRKQLDQALRSAGVTPVACLGQPADPQQQDIIDTQPTTAAEEGVVVEEAVRGYQWNGQVLRRPRVVVAVPVQESQS